MHCLKWILLGAAAVLPSVVPCQASAQEAGTPETSNKTASAPERNALEDIVVTARRRDEGVQSVPVAITAFDEKLLRDRGITEIRNLGVQVPNVSIRENAGEGSLEIGIRGINVGADNFAFDAPVGVYMNEVYVARTSDFTGSFYDVSRVQVLRGPQGTLFGRNTAVGAILIESTRPQAVFGGYAQATVGGGGGFGGKGANRSLARLEGALNVPVSSRLAVRIAGYYNYDKGWARSTATGYRNSSKDDFGVRGSLLFQPADGVEILAAYERNEFHRGAALYVPVITSTARQPSDVLNFAPPAAPARDEANALVLAGSNPYFTSHDLDSSKYNHGSTDSASLRISAEVLDGLTIRSISGWRKIDHLYWADTDGTHYLSRETRSPLKQEQVSQEVILDAQPTDQLKLLAGAYYFKETGSDENFIFVNPVAITPGTTASFPNNVRNAPFALRGENIKNVSRAVFANALWEFIPTLTASFGVRFNQERKRVFVVSAQSLERFSDDVTLYDAKLEWKPTSDILAYAKYGTGYRAGGIGFRAADAQFQAEKSETWEAGVKSDFSLGAAPARFNLAAFTTTYRDFQVNTTFVNPTRQVVVNAGSAKIKGFEADFTIEPTNSLRLMASVGYTNSRYKTLQIFNVQLGGLIDVTNNRLRMAPDWTTNLSAVYTVPSSWGEFSAQVDWSWSSGYETDAVFQKNAPGAARTDAFFQQASSVVNGRLKLADIGGSKVEAALWVHNLTDTSRKLYALSVAPATTIFSEPRSYGLDLRYAF